MAEEEVQAEEPKKKLPLKTALILVVVLVLEGAAISAAFIFSGGAADVDAATALKDEEAAKNALVEALVVEGKFQNTQAGRSYTYDAKIVVSVRQKYADGVKAELEAKQATIAAAIAAIVRSAEPVHLREAKLATVTRQIRVALDGILTVDKDSGESKIENVIIPRFTQFRTDL